jgi:hypothetical protein
MAGRGPAPKDQAKKLGHHKPEQVTELDGKTVSAPKLPSARRYSKATRDWYEVWCSSPQAAEFIVTDWQRLHMLAPMVDAYFAGDLSRLSEIRLNEAKLGGTPEDRLRLRWRMAEGKGADERAQKQAAKAKPARRRDPRLKLVDGGAA